jgi:hypothetical protein
MKTWRLHACVSFIYCVAGSLAPARGQDDARRAFDPSLSLEETVAWLGRQLTHQTSAASPDGKFVRRSVGSLAKSKGCRLSYTSVLQRDWFDSTSTVRQEREVWALALSGLDPETVVALPQGQIRFAAADSSPDAILVTIFRNEKFLTSGRREHGYFSLPVKAPAAEVVAGLRHAIGLCRQKEREAV